MGLGVAGVSIISRWKGGSVKTLTARSAGGACRRFDAGDFNCDGSYASLAEAVINNLQHAGIRNKLRPLELATFLKGYTEKSFKNLITRVGSAILF